MRFLSLLLLGCSAAPLEVPFPQQIEVLYRPAMAGKWTMTESGGPFSRTVPVELEAVGDSIYVNFEDNTREPIYFVLLHFDLVQDYSATGSEPPYRYLFDATSRSPWERNNMVIKRNDKLQRQFSATTAEQRSPFWTLSTAPDEERATLVPPVREWPIRWSALATE